jgi:hypothetical protein
MSARLGDGTDSSLPFSASTAVLEDDEVALFRSMYGVGHVAGKLRLRLPDPAGPDTNAVSSVDGDIEWKQPGIVEGITVLSQGSGYTLPPVAVFSGGSGSGALAYANLIGGRVVTVAVVNPGYGFVTTPDVRIVKSAAQVGVVTKAATVEARIAPAFTRKLTPYGSVYTPPESVVTMTAASMLGASSESQISLTSLSTPGDALLPVLPAGTWGLNGASLIQPTASLTSAWTTFGGTQENPAAASVSDWSITPAASSPLRSLALRVTSGSLSSSLAPQGVVLQNDVRTDNVLQVPRGTYGLVRRSPFPWMEWTIR